MSVAAFVPKDVCAKKIQDLASFSLPERRGHRMATVVLRTVVAPKSKVILAKQGKIMANNQAAISSKFPIILIYFDLIYFDHSQTCSKIILRHFLLYILLVY
jgi:hypothetical protein